MFMRLARQCLIVLRRRFNFILCLLGTLWGVLLLIRSLILSTMGIGLFLFYSLIGGTSRIFWRYARNILRLEYWSLLSGFSCLLHFFLKFLLIFFCFPLKHISLHHFLKWVRSHHHHRLLIVVAALISRLLHIIILRRCSCISCILDSLVIVLFLMISIVIVSCLLLSAIVLIIIALVAILLLLLIVRCPILVVISAAALLFAIVAILHFVAVLWVFNGSKFVF